MHRWGVKKSKFIERLDNAPPPTSYKDGEYDVVRDIDRAKLKKLIELDMTLPAIAEQFPEYTYEQVYDTVYCDHEFNILYRKHGKLKIKKKR